MTRVLAKVSLMLMVCCAVVLGNALPAAADETPVWEPGPEWGTAEYTELPEWAAATGCDAGEQWTWTSDQGQIAWRIIPCAESGAAMGAGMWDEPTGRELGDASVFDHSDDRVWWLPTDQQIVRQWAMDQDPEREHILVRVAVSCSSDAAAQCAQESSWVSTEIAAAMSGTPADNRFDLTLVFVLAFVGPGMLWALLVLPWRLILALLRPRYTIGDHPPRVQDLTTAVRWARVRRFIRRIAWGLALAGVLLGLGFAITGTSEQALGITAIAALLVGVLALAYKVAPPHPVERGRSVALNRTGWRGVLGVLLSSVAYALLPVLIAVYLLALAYDEIMPGWPVTAGSQLAQRPEPFARLFYGWGGRHGHDVVGLHLLRAASRVDGAVRPGSTRPAPARGHSGGRSRPGPAPALPVPAQLRRGHPEDAGTAPPPGSDRRAHRVSQGAVRGSAGPSAVDDRAGDRDRAAGGEAATDRRGPGQLQQR
ncbi:hypothetical protein [Ruania zhangjianzhongii]|uniref:hypothetical protein n=1 Tax=Ruania zhangjianzhongii TaxID=2603206 RepID=UPI0011D2C574|nr:hypothetical protein [Ruania zhangjianzhongii]